MADTDVAKKVFSDRTGVEGGAYVCPNGLKIVPTTLQKLTPDVSTPIDWISTSGLLHSRFDDITYYTA